MSRLTEYHCNVAVIKDKSTLSEAMAKLAKYEDLEDSLFKVYGECEGLLETAVKGLVKHEGANIGKPNKSILLTDEDADKWERLKDLEKQELLLKLPCKVGDKAYYVHKGGIDEVEVDSFFINVNVFANVSFYIESDRFGKTLTPYKTLFFTKAEAEEALKKMEEK